MKTVILGAGPTGLGAAYGLKKTDQGFQLFEKSAVYGGLSGAITDRNGFTWDYGGHVLYTGNEEFKKIILNALKGKYQDIVRSAWIRTFESWVPYPFQKNLHYLPVDIAIACCMGLTEKKQPLKNENFANWMERSFGKGICKYFMAPYNKKVWGIDLKQMSAGWIAERVAVTNLEEVLKSILTAKENSAWGGNVDFLYPLHNGIAGLWETFIEECSNEITYRAKAVQINPLQKRLLFEDGREVVYDKLFSTLPLNELLPIIEGASKEAVKASQSLKHNSGHIVGVGIEKRVKTEKTWVYFPEEDIPFYRMTYLHRYSPNNVPNIERYSSFMCEVSSYPASDEPLCKEQQEELIDRCIEGLVTSNIIGKDDRSKIVSRFYTFLPYSYPIPDIHRNKNLSIVHKELKRLGIASRGRFGGWCYEVGNMDHSFMMGYEWALAEKGKRAESIYPDFTTEG